MSAMIGAPVVDPRTGCPGFGMLIGLLLHLGHDVGARSAAAPDALPLQFVDEDGELHGRNPAISMASAVSRSMSARLVSTLAFAMVISMTGMSFSLRDAATSTVASYAYSSMLRKT